MTSIMSWLKYADSVLVYQRILTSLLLIYCLYISYVDIRYKVIKNRYTFGMMILGMLNQIVFLIFGMITLHQFISIFLIGGAISYLLYFLSVWGAGDSKFFWALLMFLPPLLFGRLSANQSLIFAVLANIFAPYFFFVSIYLILKSSREQKLKAAREIRKELTGTRIVGTVFKYLCFIGLSYLISSLLGLLGVKYFYLKILIILLFFPVFDKAVQRYNLKKARVYILSPLLVVAIFAIPSVKFLVSCLLIIMFVKLFLGFVILGMGDSFFVRDVSIFDLQEGMIPAERIAIEKTEDGRVSYRKEGRIRFANPFRDGVLLDVGIHALSEDKVKELKQLARDGNLEGMGNEIKIQEPMVFAPIISLGVLLTVIFGGPFYQWF